MACCGDSDGACAAQGAVTNSLHASHVYRHHSLPVLDVRLLGGHRRIATDGEVGPLGNRFCFYSRPSALTIYRS